MWLFSTKHSLLGSGVFHGWTDWHCHMLPGVDDGVRSLDKTLKYLSVYAEMGVMDVWFTPHIMEDFPNTTEDLRKRFREVQAAYKGPIQLHLGAENMMDNLFEERLEKGDLLPLPNDYLLVETSYFSPPYDLWGTLKRIQEKGYRPLLAHPERYVYMGDREYKKLAEKGVALQLNLPSLCNLYGPEVRRKAYTLLKEGAYQRCGSDLHRLSPIKHGFEEPQFKKEIIEAVRKLGRYEEDL